MALERLLRPIRFALLAEQLRDFLPFRWKTILRHFALDRQELVRLDFVPLLEPGPVIEDDGVLTPVDIGVDKLPFDRLAVDAIISARSGNASEQIEDAP